MTILGIESTCDETSIGIVKNGVSVIANITASSATIHEKYGGVVPEIAAREQIRSIIPVFKEALRVVDLKRIDAIAVAYGPGLIGSLLIGVETAKTLASIFEKPLIRVNHLLGHIYAPWLNLDGRKINFPAIALIVSGGHTDLLLIKDHGNFVFLGGTLDDAAGEAFDKVARILKLKYPGGPEIENLATKFNNEKSAIHFPSSLNVEGNLDFSFSGIKTAVLNYTLRNPNYDREEIAFAFQNCVVDILVKKTLLAAKQSKVKTLIVGGGVSANRKFKTTLFVKAKNENITCFFPEKEFSTDNGAMIASAAFFNKNFVNPHKLLANASLYF